MPFLPTNQQRQSTEGNLKHSVQITEQLIVSHASQIILERIRVKTETETADEQAGFRQGRGTTDQIILMHKAREHQHVLCGLQEGVRLYLP